MPDFSNRSSKKELLDREDIPFADIKKNMQELDVINKYLGGHAITLAGLKKLIGHYTVNNQPVMICEIGCGDGNNMKVINEWCRQKNIPVEIWGIDINPHCIDYARSIPANKNFTFICSDYKEAMLEKKPAIIFSSLFCHHFNADALKDMMLWMRSNATIGFFINDLHRHPLAYYSIRWLTSLFSKSYLVKNDAPLSVLRGFHKNEWLGIMDQAGILNFSIKWKWAFRWLIIVKHK